MTYCGQCGRASPDGAAYCSNCGAALGTPPPAPAQTAAPSPAPWSSYPSPAPPLAPSPPFASPRPRPLGVSILAVLKWIGASFGILFGIIYAFMGPLIAQSLAKDPSANPATAPSAADLSTIGPILTGLGIFMILISGVYIWLGWAMWVGKPWARIVNIVFTCIGLGFSALGVVSGFFSTVTLGPAGAGLAALIIVIYALSAAWYGFLLWYWMRPGVKAYFGPPAPPVATAPTW